jgi:hypothetical protein
MEKAGYMKKTGEMRVLGKYVHTFSFLYNKLIS